MESLFKSHELFLKNVKKPLHRKWMDQVDWNARLICIKGFRGSGKTTALIQYAKMFYPRVDRRCLYINLDSFYFSTRSLKDFAYDFMIKGGEVLLIDQIFKYPKWEETLFYCYENYPDLKIIFSAPAAVRIDNEDVCLSDKAKVYDVYGFSFREYLELQTQIEFSAYTLKDILSDHAEIARHIASKVRPIAYINDYLIEGFCPFHLEDRSFPENFLEKLNMMLEVDLLAINQIDHRYIPKIRKLLYLLSTMSPSCPNVSQLSIDIDTSRATVMNYIKSLEDSRIIGLVYAQGDEYPKKPARIYANNSSLLYATHQDHIDEQVIRETFFYNQVNHGHRIHLGRKSCQFTVDGEYDFHIGNQIKGKFNPDAYYAISGIEQGEKKVIPLWLFGFLY